MNCQFLYDLRALTGWISGQDLHSIFVELVGEPSPSGRRHIPEDRLREYQNHDTVVAELLARPEILDALSNYTGEVAQFLAANGLRDAAQQAEAQHMTWYDYEVPPEVDAAAVRYRYPL